MRPTIGQIVSLILIHGLACVHPVSTFWDQPRHGANMFNRVVRQQDIEDAKKLGIEFLRVAPDKYMCHAKDFLIGDADGYKQPVKQDLAVLMTVLDMCLAEQMPVVLTMLSLPGSRWKQHNLDIDDLRLWVDDSFIEQAAQFWQDLAIVLKEHPAIVGYNILNEPHPEKICTQLVDTSVIRQKLDVFNRVVCRAIRQADPYTPIIIDSSDYASPQAFDWLLPLEDIDNVMYAFHMYEPYSYTCHALNRGSYCYPGLIDGKYWDKTEIQSYVLPVLKFQCTYQIENSRIIAEEFGANRRSPGLECYMKDLLSVFKDNGWHYAFYSFREDTWDGMNYELCKTSCEGMGAPGLLALLTS